MDSQKLVSHFARLARENARRARYWLGQPEGNMESQYFAGRSNAYLTAARIAKGEASGLFLRRAA